MEVANAIGTTHLRAQTLREPKRTRSLELLELYTDATIRLSESVPGSAASRDAIAERGGQRRARPYLDGQLRRLGLG